MNNKENGRVGAKEFSGNCYCCPNRDLPFDAPLTGNQDFRDKNLPLRVKGSISSNHCYLTENSKKKCYENYLALNLPIFTQ